jgi:hypothetical protein
MLRQTTYLFSGDALRLEQRGWLGTRVVLARHLCAHFELPCSGVAWYQTRTYAATQARAREVFAQSAWAALRCADVLHLWVWDAERLNIALRAAGLESARLQVWPESVLRAPANGGSVQLWACLNGGFEGQRHNAAGLAHAYWWPQEPTAAQWATQFEPARLPSAQRRDWLGAPTRFAIAGRASASTARNPARTSAVGWAVGLGCVGMCAVAGYLGMHELQLRSLDASLAQQRAALSGQAQGFLKAKQNASADVLRAKPIADFVRHPHPGDALLAWAEAFALRGWVLREFDVRSGELRMVIATAGQRLDANEVLDLLQASPLLRDVRVEINAAMLDMRVSAKWANTQPEPATLAAGKAKP